MRTFEGSVKFAMAPGWTRRRRMMRCKAGSRVWSGELFSLKLEIQEARGQGTVDWPRLFCHMSASQG